MAQLWQHLERTQRRQLIVLQLVAIVMALSTVSGVAAVLPFFAVLADPGAIERNALLSGIYRELHFTGARAFEVALGVGFVLLLLLANIINLAGTLAMNRFAHAVGDGFHVKLFDEYLHRSYRFHSQSNSTLLTGNVIYETARLTGGLLQGGLILISSAVTVVCIVTAIVVVNPVAAAVAGAGLGGSYALIYWVVRARLLRNGLIESRFYGQRARIASEGFGAIKEIIVARAQRRFVTHFERACAEISAAVVSNIAIAQSPRYLLESATVCALVAVALYLSGPGAGTGPWIADLSFFGMAAYRLLPALQQAFVAVAKIRADRSAIDVVAGDLRQARARLGAVEPPVDDFWRGRPQRDIRLQEVSFRYAEEGPSVVSNVTLCIPAGTTVGLVGGNGSGKTTLVDLLTGLLVPDSGRIEIDGAALDDSSRPAWQHNIGYVPQHVFLLDATVAENIALGDGDGEIDRARVREAARLARLADCVAALPRGYDEVLGEKGARLSGGERQRLAIARALYRGAAVLILDEATSSLDGYAEDQIVEMLRELQPRPTVVLIAHRLNALRRCDLIYELDRGKVVRSVTYAELRPAHRLAAGGVGRKSCG